VNEIITTNVWLLQVGRRKTLFIIGPIGLHIADKYRKLSAQGWIVVTFVKFYLFFK